MKMRDPSQLNYGEVLSMDNLRTILSSIGDHWLTKLLVAVVLTVNDWFFHPKHDVVLIVFIFIVFDTVTGLLKAYREHTISSSGFFRFALKLTVYLILLAVGALLDKIIPGTDIVSALSIFGVFLSLTECLSICENVSALGYSVPTRLISGLKLAKRNLEEDPKTPPKESVDKQKP